MAKIGFLDSVEDGVLKGWAIEEGAERPAVIDISIDGVLITQVTCSQFRPDLVTAKRGHGWHGFWYPLPAKYMQCGGKLVVRFSNGGPVLNNGERVLPDFTHRFLVSSALVASVMRNGLWFIDLLNFFGSELIVEGWCIPPRLLPVPAAITHNGEPLTEITWFPRDDLALALHMERDEINFGFRARGPLSTAATRHDFTYQHLHTGRSFDPNQSIHYMSCAKPLPPPELRTRVHGSDDPMMFIKEGSSAYLQMLRFLQDYFAKSLEDCTGILDWGCGSGRTLRYFPDDLLPKLTGIDIDSEAITWCRQAFPQGRFLSVATEPSTPLATESFDLIYGISVLTHLREKDQIAWLEELQRLAKPQAILLLTFSGDCRFWNNKFPSKLFTQWKIAGFLEGGRNPNLDSLGIGDYYRNTYISHDYIWRNWSRYFKIVDLIPVGICNGQDLAILQKRG